MLSLLVEHLEKVYDIHYYYCLGHILLDQRNGDDLEGIKYCQKNLEEHCRLYSGFIPNIRKNISNLEQISHESGRIYQSFKNTELEKKQLIDEQIKDILQRESNNLKENSRKSKRKLELRGLEFFQNLVSQGYSEEISAKLALRPELREMIIYEKLRIKYRISDSIPYPYVNRPGILSNSI